MGMTHNVTLLSVEPTNIPIVCENLNQATVNMATADWSLILKIQ